MRVLVTGGAGFIGSHLVDLLLAEGHEVRILDSLDPQVHDGVPGYLSTDAELVVGDVRALDNLDPQVHGAGEGPDYLDDAVELVVGDVRDHDAVRDALDGVDTVVHFAAAVGVGQSMYEIERYTSINAIGAAVVLEEATTSFSSRSRAATASSSSTAAPSAFTDV